MHFSSALRGISTATVHEIIARKCHVKMGKINNYRKVTRLPFGVALRVFVLL